MGMPLRCVVVNGLLLVTVILARTDSLCAERYPLLADTRIDSRDVNVNFGADALIRLVRNSETDRDGSFVRGLLQFDLPDLPREEVAEARLWMVLTRARGPAGYNPYERNLVIRPLAAAFDELSATWQLRNFEPELLWESPGGDFLLDPAKRIAWQPPQGIVLGDGTWWCSWDLLPLWDDVDLRNHGAVLMLDPETPPDAGFLTYAFGSREYLSDVGDFRPYVEVVLEGLAGDFDGDRVLSAHDIDLLSAAVRAAAHDPDFDLNADSLVDANDRVVWVEQEAGTWFGDADLDGEFNSSDFVQVFVAGKYETNDNAGWAEGDWDGSSRFDSADFVTAFQGGGYEMGPRIVSPAVPEPGGMAGWLLAALIGGRSRRRSPRRQQGITRDRS